MDWDRAETEWIGAIVLVGMTYLRHDGEVDRQEQFFGQIEAVDRDRGVSLRLSGSREGETCDLPPDLAAFTTAAPGRYELRSTGEVVVNPDLLTTWMISPPSHS